MKDVLTNILIALGIKPEYLLVTGIILLSLAIILTFNFLPKDK